MKRLVTAFALVLVSMPLAAQAQYEFGDRRLKMIEDPLQMVFMGDPAKLTKQQMHQAIEIAALAKDWKILGASDGRFELTTTKNGRHVLRVVMTYTATGCEIRYVDSVEMMYREIQEGTRAVRVIHRNYNVWIRELADAVSNRIGQPARVSAPAAVVAYSGRQEGAPPPFRTRFDRANRWDRPGSASRESREMARAEPPAPAHNRVVPPASGFAKIDDVDKVPVREAGKDRYRTFLKAPPPKAFVVAEDGGWEMFAEDADAIALALDHCERVKVGCWLYAVDDRVVFDADPGKRISRLSQLPRAAP